MPDSSTIEYVDVLDGNLVIVALTDSRVFTLTLDQILNANPQQLPPDESPNTD
ncbi:hypothetical protein [Terriglobus sp.]|uniref:hypothetical protein n=1 Tax=Terriglobus sp. TaxID=1889013 RepID=UPI003B005D33